MLSARRLTDSNWYTIKFCPLKLTVDSPNEFGEEELELALMVFDMCFAVVAECMDFVNDEEHSINDVAKDFGPTLSVSSDLYPG